MKTITIHSGQNILDICLQEYGSVEALIQLAKDNDLAIDADLVAGQELLIDESKIIEPQIVKYFADRDIKVNTGAYLDVTGEDGVFDETFDQFFE